MLLKTQRFAAKANRSYIYGPWTTDYGLFPPYLLQWTMDRGLWAISSSSSISYLRSHISYLALLILHPDVFSIHGLSTINRGLFHLVSCIMHLVSLILNHASLLSVDYGPLTVDCKLLRALRGYDF